MSKATSAEWFNRSWSPISGRCPNNCLDLEGNPYCWMWRPGGIADRFRATHDHPLMLNEKILNHPPKTGRVLVGSSTDMWVKEVPNEWLRRIFYQISWFKKYPLVEDVNDPIFFFLTKKARRYQQTIKQGLTPPRNAWYGATWDGMPKNRYNVLDMQSIFQYERGRNIWQPKTYISFEPLLADPTGLDLSGIQWIIIGADSRNGKPKPPKEWADYLIAEAKRVGAMVFVKDNYNYPEKIKEMPC